MIHGVIASQQPLYLIASLCTILSATEAITTIEKQGFITSTQGIMIPLGVDLFPPMIQPTSPQIPSAGLTSMLPAIPVQLSELYLGLCSIGFIFERRCCEVIPNNLISIARVLNNDKNCIKMSLKCHCECEYFKLFKKCKTKEEIQRDKEIDQLFKGLLKKSEIQFDSNGNAFVVQKNLFDKEIKRIAYDPKKEFWNFISVQCASCQARYVLFDERFHGYDACVSPRIEYDDVDPIIYDNQASRFNVQVYYSNDLSEDEDITNDKTLAFGRIKIYSIDGRKKTTVIDCECS